MAGRKKATTEEIKKNFGFDEQSEQAFKSIVGVKDEEKTKEAKEKKKEPAKKQTAAKETVEEEEAQPTKITEEQSRDSIIVVVERKEARSKRINLLITPSVYASAKKKCKMLNISMNECVNQFLEKWSKETK